MTGVRPASTMGSPPQRAAMTPGQAAYEASVLVMADDFEYPPWRWDQLPQKHRDSWDAAAQAAVTAGTGRILAEAARYKAERDEARAERDKLTEGCRALNRVVNSQARAMYAALIDAIHGDPNDASSILTEQLDGFDGEQWNGTETGIEWLERTHGEDGDL